MGEGDRGFRSGDAFSASNRRRASSWSPPLPPHPRSSGPPSCFSDSEAKRRRRIAKYKAYAVEGKVKTSLRKGFRWFKAKCCDMFS